MDHELIVLGGILEIVFSLSANAEILSTVS